MRYYKVRSSRRKYSILRRRTYGIFKAGPSSGGSTKRDVRPVEPKNPEDGEYDPGKSVFRDRLKEELRRRRMTDEAYRRAMSGERESGARYSFSYGYY